MISVEGRQVINRPIDQVWKYLTSIENASKWDAGTLEARQISSGTVGLGTTLETVREMRSKRRSMKALVSEYDPSKKVAWTIDAGVGTGKRIYTFEPAVCGTLLSKTTQVELKGFYKLLTPILRRRFNQSIVEQDLDNIKLSVEASA